MTTHPLLRVLAALALSVSLLAGARAEAAEDSQEQQTRQQLAQQAQVLFQAREFKQLDRIYDGYALQGSRTSSGLWKSTLVDAGMRELAGYADTPEEFDRLEALIQQWLRERPESALARLTHAHLLYGRAWNIRGRGYANTVDPQSWKPFYDGLRETREYLEAHKAVASARPEYYVLMINVLKGQQHSPLPVFDEGIGKFPAHYQMYFAMLDYLLPKWHGGAEQVEHFASEAVARTQDSEGRGMYARVYWYASQAQFYDRLFTDSKVSWERMRAGFDDVVARYPDQWNLQNYASFACDVGDLETLKKLFERVREPSIDLAWRSRERFVQCGRSVGKFKD